MTKRKSPPTGDYEVGYGKPPKASQFKSKAAGKRRGKPDQLDVTKVLSESVDVSRDGVTQKLTSFEIALRAQIKKAVKDRTVNAILHVLSVAEKYDLIKPAPKAERRGGVLIVPERYTKEQWEALFAAAETMKKAGKR
ncbi:MAG: hypothetical protein ACK5KM_16085 [Hyphomicrobiaceae bacterium]